MRNNLAFFLKKEHIELLEMNTIAEVQNSKTGLRAD